MAMSVGSAPRRRARAPYAGSAPHPSNEAQTTPEAPAGSRLGSTSTYTSGKRSGDFKARVA